MISKLKVKKGEIESSNYYTSLIKLFILSLLTVTLVFFPSASDVKATTSNFDNENDEEDESMTTVTTIRAKLHVHNFDTKKYDHIKLVGYLNGEGQVSYLDLKEYNQKTEGTTQQTPITVDLNFNSSNDISSVMFDDEYFVCAYALGNRISYNTVDLPVYDCDEGNIGQSTTSDTVKLFSTMKKYNDSNDFYKSQQNLINDQTPGKIKINVDVPLSDSKDLEDMRVVGMIKGEYNIVTVDVQDELNKAGSNNDRILVTFTFNRQTESGLIQPGDMFFGCATSDAFTNQNSDCEKRILQDLSNLNSLCARKDNQC